MAHAHVSDYAKTPAVSTDNDSLTVRLGDFRIVMTAAEATQLLADMGSALHAMPNTTKEPA